MMVVALVGMAYMSASFWMQLLRSKTIDLDTAVGFALATALLVVSQ